MADIVAHITLTRSRYNCIASSGQASPLSSTKGMRNASDVRNSRFPHDEILEEMDYSCAVPLPAERLLSFRASFKRSPYFFARSTAQLAKEESPGPRNLPDVLAVIKARPFVVAGYDRAALPAANACDMNLVALAPIMAGCRYLRDGSGFDDGYQIDTGSQKLYCRYAQTKFRPGLGVLMSAFEMC